MLRIFVSYSRVDEKEIKQFSQFLGYGYDVWYDQAASGIIGGEDWWQRIISEIAVCEHFVYLLSPESVKSEYCDKELGKAFELEKHIIPVRIRARTQLPEKIKHLQVIDAYGDKLVDGISRVYGAIVRNTKIETEPQLTEAHRQADLRVLKEIWELIDSDFIIGLYKDFGIFHVVWKEKFDRLRKYMRYKQNPERTINNQQLERFFVKFDNLCNRVVQLTIEVLDDEKSPDYYSLPAISMTTPQIYRLNQEIDQIKQVGNQFLMTYQELVKFIKLNYPEFTFDTNEE